MINRFDFDAAVQAPFRMQPGLRRMAAGARHFTPIAPGSRHQREKLAVLSAFVDDALCAEPGFDATPAFEHACRVAAAEHPEHFSIGADGTVESPRLGLRVDADGRCVQTGAGVFGLGDEVPRCVEQLPAEWRRAGLAALTFLEDLAVADAASTRVPWLAVCLPSHWSPREKVGQPFAAIHAPVADAEQLRQSAAALTRLVASGERWERFVWTITDTPRLHTHPHRTDARRWSHDEPALREGRLPRAWFRSERQTFIGLPERGQSVFTIAVDVLPLERVVEGRARARALAAAIGSMSDAVLAYRGLREVRAPLLAWLAERG